MPDTNASHPTLSSLARGGGGGCKLDPGVLDKIISEHAGHAAFPNLMIDAATPDDAAVYRISDDTALVATTDFFAPVVDDPATFGAIAATNALSDVYAMGATPIFSLAIVGMPIGQLAHETIRIILDGGRALAALAPFLEYTRLGRSPLLSESFEARWRRSCTRTWNLNRKLCAY